MAFHRCLLRHLSSPVVPLNYAQAVTEELSAIKYSYSLLSNLVLSSQDAKPVYNLAKDQGSSNLLTRNNLSNSYFDQNVDIPMNLYHQKKKPFVKPLKLLRKKSNQGDKPLQPPANGLLVPELVPIAHETLKARSVVISGASKLLKLFSVKVCRYCPEVHVGPVGHQIASCRGSHNGSRRGRHDWTDGGIHDILPRRDVFHLADRLGKVIKHEDRHKTEKVPAVVELCIQAGVDIPRYPTKRRIKPAAFIDKKLVELDELENRVTTTWLPRVREFDESSDCPQDNNDYGVQSPQTLAGLAEKTMKAWFLMRNGTKKLMTKYYVQVCGYCPQVHVGPKGTKTSDCKAFKHQQRDGHHGWQEASIDDIIPPVYVWHLLDRLGPPLASELRVFYGAAPAIVELCVQAGASVPEDYKSMMRLDVVIPDLNELHKVA